MDHSEMENLRYLIAKYERERAELLDYANYLAHAQSIQWLAHRDANRENAIKSRRLIDIALVQYRAQLADMEVES